MCIFVVATLPGEADLATVGRIFAAHHLGFSQIENMSLRAQLPAGERCILTTMGHCDCETPLGTGRKYAEVQEHHRDLERLRKRGWSEARSKKWLAQKEADRERFKSQLAARNEAQSMNIEKWLALIHGALGATRRIGLLLHMYRGEVANETLTVTRRSIPADQLSADSLLTMEHDVVCEFAR